MIADDLEDILKRYLQQDVQFVLNDRIVREGRIVLFNIKDFYVTFIIHTKKNQNKKNYPHKTIKNPPKKAHESS